MYQAMGLAGSHVLGGEEALRSLSDNRICGVWWGLIIAIFSIAVSPHPHAACPAVLVKLTNNRSRTLENGAS